MNGTEAQGHVFVFHPRPRLRVLCHTPKPLKPKREELQHSTAENSLAGTAQFFAMSSASPRLQGPNLGGHRARTQVWSLVHKPFPSKPDRCFATIKATQTQFPSHTKTAVPPSLPLEEPAFVTARTPSRRSLPRFQVPQSPTGVTRSRAQAVYMFSPIPGARA